MGAVARSTVVENARNTCARRYGSGVDTVVPAAALAGAPDLEAACRIAVAALADDRALAVAAYVGRAGRLRCLAAAGTAHILDGVSAVVGPVGRAAATGAEQRTLSPEGAETACLPLIQGDEVVGVLSVEASGSLDGDQLAAARAVSTALARRILELGGPPAEGSASRLAQHAAALAGMEDPGRIEHATLVAALDLAGMESAALFRLQDDDSWAPAVTAGTLGARLATLGIVPLDGLAMLVAGGGSCSFDADRVAVVAELPLGLGRCTRRGRGRRSWRRCWHAVARSACWSSPTSVCCPHRPSAPSSSS